MLRTTSSDGSSVEAFDEGSGFPVLIVHGGMDDGSGWNRVAARLAPQFRVIRLRRREHRVDAPATTAQEVGDVQAVARTVGGPVLLVGHSSGAVLALETMVAAPTLAAGAVIYEPPVRIDSPVGGEAVARIAMALAANRPGRAMRIFARDVVRMPAWAAWVGGWIVTVHPRYRRLAKTHLHLEEVEAAGHRLGAYAAIAVPIVLVGGDRSPAHLGERLESLLQVLPKAERVVLHGHGHNAHRTAPTEFARIVEAHASRVFRSRE